MESGTPFDLKSAVAAWRRRLLAHPGIWPSDLDELETHLWDEIEWRTEQGTTKEAAFEEAVSRLGSGDELAGEFASARRSVSLFDRDPRRVRGVSSQLLVHNIKIAWRYLSRGRGYAAISVAGLAVGIASLLLIFAFVRGEWSTDGFHAHGDRIFRIASDVTYQGDVRREATSPQRLAPLLKERFPGVERAVRIDQYRSNVIGTDSKSFVEDRAVLLADSEFFSVFSFTLLEGNPTSALMSPFSVVISQRAALKYFDGDSPLGRTLQIDHHDYTVTGLVEDPHDSHLTFDFLVSRSTRRALFGSVVDEIQENWQAGTHTYVLLSDGTDPSRFQDELTKYVGTQITDPELSMRFKLQALPDIYLGSDRLYEFLTGDRRQILILSSIGAFILLIACVNFINLTTARANRRLGEVGVRRVVGASRWQLVRQFLLESVVITSLALVVAVILATILLPSFGSLIDTRLEVGQLWDAYAVPVTLALVAFVALVSGSYPAVVMSRAKPGGGIRGAISSGERSRIRSGLVLFQFVITITLIACTFVVWAQLGFIHNRPLGYDADQVLVLRWRDFDGFPDRYPEFKQEVLAIPGVSNVTASTTNGILGAQEPLDTEQETTLQAEWVGVDYDFIQTLGLDLTEGRVFSADVAGDARNAFIINESAASALGWTDPVGRPFAINGRDGAVIGVVKDFNTASLHEPVVPTVLQVMSIRAMPFVSIRLAGNRINETLASVEKKWGEFAPGWPFEYSFLDAEVDAMYRSDRRLGDIVEIAAAVAIVIACLGLFGLAAYQVERRRKEIGIRKVHGASTARICRLLSAGALLPVLGATVLSGPIVYIAMNAWLQAFAYRITIGPGFILLAGCTAIAIAAATVAAQTLRAARANPIVSLRYE